jgi:Phosphotransferase enzyme family
MAGFPCPRIVAVLGDPLKSESWVAAGHPGRLVFPVLSSWVAATSVAQLSQDDRLSALARLPQLIDRMVKAAVPCWCEDGMHDAPPDTATWAELESVIPPAVEWQPVRQAARDLGPLLEAISAATEEPIAGPRWVLHRDPQPRNFFVRSRRLWLLDWESCGPSTVEAELFRVAWTWCVDDGGVNHDAITALVRAFQQQCASAPPLALNGSWSADYLARSAAYCGGILRDLMKESASASLDSLRNKTLEDLSLVRMRLELAPKVERQLKRSYAALAQR